MVESDAPTALTDEQRELLASKLEQYQSRIEDADRSENWRICAIHRVAIIRRRLNQESVDQSALQEELGGNFNHRYYTSAVFVIDDYIATGGANVCGGRN